MRACQLPDYTRLQGSGTGRELVLLNPRLSAKDAKAAGLITAVLPNESFDAEVPAAGVDRLDYHLDEELQQLVRIAEGKDFAEGLASFFGKREAAFNGQD